MPKATCDWSKQPLGLVPDEVLSEQLGVSIHTVKRQRHRAGILFIDMDIKTRIADALANRQAMTVSDLADALDKQTTWIQRNCKEMAKAGTLWRHKAGRGYVYTLAGVKYRHLSPFNGSQEATGGAAGIEMEYKTSGRGPLRARWHRNRKPNGWLRAAVLSRLSRPKVAKIEFVRPGLNQTMVNKFGIVNPGLS